VYGERDRLGNQRVLLYNPIWHVKNINLFKMHCKAGTDLTELCPATGRTLLEHLVDSKYTDKNERIRLLVDNGVDIQPLYDTLYKASTVKKEAAAVRAIMRLGYNVDLEKTLAYRLMHFQVPYEELINCFLYYPN